MDHLCEKALLVDSWHNGTRKFVMPPPQAFANHRAMAAVFGTILELPPVKQALASKQLKSIYLDKLLARHKMKA